MQSLLELFDSTGIAHLDDVRFLIMIGIGLVFIYLAVTKNYEPLLLVPIGFGMILTNIPWGFDETGQLITLLADPHSPFHWLYLGITHEIYPPLIFLGIGAMTDFSFMICSPRLVLLGAAAQVGIFGTFLGSLALGFTAKEAGSIGIIGGADGPTAIYVTSLLNADFLAPISIAAYSYMALVPIIQPPIMRLLTTRKERLIRMPQPRQVSRLERVVFPIAGLLLTCLLVPKALPLLGMLFFGNLLSESGVTDRLAVTAKTSFIDIVTILLGLCVGVSANAQTFLTTKALMIFGLGVAAFCVATAAGILFAKLMNLVTKDKINPLVGAAGVSAVPMAARVVNTVALQEDPSNFLLMHAMAPNVAGVIGSAVAAGVLLAFLL
ncbi:MAG: sodium ion-translocating decarboxylase subunit beta [Candidatus Lernaella stagnicola]|nr:sodium ion-translocating decarboxylase subunit beta [Candidatus Lernaella stagnicola]